MPPRALTVLRPVLAECGKPTGLGLYHFDARCIDVRLRHAATFAALAVLGSGETMRYYDDRDPLPLLVAIERRFGPAVSLAFVSRNAAEVIIDVRIGAAVRPRRASSAVADARP